MAEAIERETTGWSVQRLGSFVRSELQLRGVKSVEVYRRRGKEYARTWFVEFEPPSDVERIRE